MCLLTTALILYPYQTVARHAAELVAPAAKPHTLRVDAEPGALPLPGRPVSQVTRAFLPPFTQASVQTSPSP